MQDGLRGKKQVISLFGFAFGFAWLWAWPSRGCSVRIWLQARLELCQHGKGVLARADVVPGRLEGDAGGARVGVEREAQFFEQRSGQIDMRRGEKLQIVVAGVGDFDVQIRAAPARRLRQQAVAARERTF